MASALVTRVMGIASRPLWYDEAFAVLFASKGLPAMLEGTLYPVYSGGSAASDIHPLLYYTLLGQWMRWFGSTPAAVRALSVLFGLAVAALTYLLGCRLFGSKTGFVAGIMAALSPFQVHYAQEVRMYALMNLCILGAAAALWQGIHSRKAAWWVLFALLAALAQYSHNLASLHLLVLAATPVILLRWKDALKTFLAGLAALLLYLPWLLVTPGQLARLQAGYWIERPGPDRLLTGLISYVTNLPLPGIWLPVGLSISLLVTAIAAWQTLRAVYLARTGDCPDETLSKSLWLVWMAFVPMLLLFLLSQWQPVWIERALLPSGLFFLLWLAWAFTKTSMPTLARWVGLGLLAAGMLTGLGVHLTYTGFPYAPFTQVGEAIQERVQVGDLVLHSNKLSALPVVYTTPGLRQSYLADPAGSRADTLAPATQRVLGLPAEPELESAVGEAKRVWFISFTRELEEYQQAGFAQHPHLEWLKDHFFLLQIEAYGELRVYLYAR